MLQCSACLQTKPKTAFYTNRHAKKVYFSPKCRLCYRAAVYKARADDPLYHAKKNERSRRDRADRRQRVKQVLEQNGCSQCSEKDVRTLDFHHLDPSQKSYEISRMVQTARSWKQIQLEMQKCAILCSNCHRKLTF